MSLMNLFLKVITVWFIILNLLTHGWMVFVGGNVNRMLQIVLTLKCFMDRKANIFIYWC